MLVKRIMAAVLCVCVVVGVIGTWGVWRCWAVPLPEVAERKTLFFDEISGNLEIWVYDGGMFIFVKSVTFNLHDTDIPLVPPTTVHVKAPRIYWVRTYSRSKGWPTAPGELKEDLIFESGVSNDVADIVIPSPEREHQIIAIALPEGGTVSLYGHDISVRPRQGAEQWRTYITWTESDIYYMHCANTHMIATGNLRLLPVMTGRIFSEYCEKYRYIETVDGQLPCGEIQVYDTEENHRLKDTRPYPPTSIPAGFGHGFHFEFQFVEENQPILAKIGNVFKLQGQPQTPHSDPSAGQGQSQTKPAALTRVKAVVATGVATAAIAGAVIYFTPFRRRKKEEGKEAVNNEDDA